MPDAAAVYLYQQPDPPSRYVELAKFEARAVGGEAVASGARPHPLPSKT